MTRRDFVLLALSSRGVAGLADIASVASIADARSLADAGSLAGVGSFADAGSVADAAGTADAAPRAAPREVVRVGVFGLFHPDALILRATGEGGLALRTDRDTFVLRGREAAQVRVVTDSSSMDIVCAGVARRARTLRVADERGGFAVAELSVPGKIARLFRGQIDVEVRDDALVPIVSMDVETAVASVVAAEQVGSTPLEALKAQAVAARSFLLAARGRHRGFDFCDTTHCQFLREPPAEDQPAARAARETAGLVLTYRDAPFPAFYSASCGGRTRSLADAGLSEADGYPYFGVDCPSCARAHQPREGHGLGLCQTGAAGYAAGGRASFTDILAHYYPGTRTVTASTLP
jgi:hypothetical protein